MIIFITGITSGIGKALTIHYLGNGDTVVGIGRNKDKLSALSEMAKNYQGVLYCQKIDVTSKKKLNDYIDYIENRVGEINIVIANAGIACQQYQAKLDTRILSDLLNVNVVGVMNTIEPILGYMMQRKRGQVVIISSMASIQSIPGMSMYCASKSAINVLSESLYWLLQPYHITVTTVCPGFIETEMISSLDVPDIMLVPLDRSVKKILIAIEKRKKIYYFPYWQRILMVVIKLLPDSVKKNILVNFVDRISKY
ncbi:SDR family NAD(P)-dependent oxidoreductase [Endozoicomonas atrinae]|uniref:SDR family NAD(P)-dependent oxidoreductase n=1 Tax=Endozoicomonas atrinae TaxID=1333660 RepID=UPI000825EBD1|nr:SDR family NAD(P)-dependent oxidoreductase [Endozoicomonas atrinae]